MDRKKGGIDSSTIEKIESDNDAGIGDEIFKGLSADVTRNIADCLYAFTDNFPGALGKMSQLSEKYKKQESTIEQRNGAYLKPVFKVCADILNLRYQIQMNDSNIQMIRHIAYGLICEVLDDMESGREFDIDERYCSDLLRHIILLKKYVGEILPYNSDSIEKFNENPLDFAIFGIKSNKTGENNIKEFPFYFPIGEMSKNNISKYKEMILGGYGNIYSREVLESIIRKNMLTFECVNALIFCLTNQQSELLIAATVRYLEKEDCYEFGGFYATDIIHRRGLGNIFRNIIFALIEEKRIIAYGMQEGETLDNYVNGFGAAGIAVVETHRGIQGPLVQFEWDGQQCYRLKNMGVEAFKDCISEENTYRVIKVSEGERMETITEYIGLGYAWVRILRDIQSGYLYMGFEKKILKQKKKKK